MCIFYLQFSERVRAKSFTYIMDFHLVYSSISIVPSIKAQFVNNLKAVWSSKGSSRSKWERGKLLWVFSEAFTLPRASWIVCLHSKLYFFYYQALRSRDFHTFDGCEKQSGLQQQQSAPSYKHVARRIIIHTTYYYQIPVLVFLTPRPYMGKKH